MRIYSGNDAKELKRRSAPIRLSPAVNTGLPLDPGNTEASIRNIGSPLKSRSGTLLYIHDALIKMARALGLGVIAEGVEDFYRMKSATRHRAFC